MHLDTLTNRSNGEEGGREGGREAKLISVASYSIKMGFHGKNETEELASEQEKDH